jgi:hypothetical protein
MAAITGDIVRGLAESMGHSGISDDVHALLAPDLEVRLREIIQVHIFGLQLNLSPHQSALGISFQDACKFARHGKRRSVTHADFNRALRLRNVEVCGLQFIIAM